MPSPMRPVRAAFWMASMEASRRDSRHHDLDLHFGQKVHDIFGAPVKFGMALLAAEALGFGHGDALNADFLQRLLHFVEFEWLDDGFDFFHAHRCCLRAQARGLNGVAGLVPAFLPQYALEIQGFVQVAHRQCAVRLPTIVGKLL